MGISCTTHAQLASWHSAPDDSTSATHWPFWDLTHPLSGWFKCDVFGILLLLIAQQTHPPSSSSSQWHKQSRPPATLQPMSQGHTEVMTLGRTPFPDYWKDKELWWCAEAKQSMKSRFFLGANFKRLVMRNFQSNRLSQRLQQAS